MPLPLPLTCPCPCPALVPCPLEQICVPVESASPLVLNNQKEVLRCFTELGKRPAAQASVGAGTLAALVWLGVTGFLVQLCLGLPVCGP